MFPVSPKEAFPEFDLNKQPQPNRFSITYESFYSMFFPDATHYFGLFKSGKFDIAAHFYKPAFSKATALIFHGYIEHSASMKHIVKACLDNNISAALIDLPGHGLSSGVRYSIDNFSTYGNAVNDFLSKLKSFTVVEPFFAIGFSTGCSAVIESLYQGNPDIFKGSILLAPLVHSAEWKFLNIIYFLGHKWVKTVPRIYRPLTGNPEFEQFHRKDPLRGKKVPSQWFKALLEWNSTMSKRPSIHEDTLIIQGDRDSTVDWRYNVAFVKNKLGADVIMIPGARHHLTNESLELRKITLEKIVEFINSRV
jgi:alpha-beta hydrolase superfamily lysophospholipase